MVKLVIDGLKLFKSMKYIILALVALLIALLVVFFAGIKILNIYDLKAHQTVSGSK